MKLSKLKKAAKLSVLSLVILSIGIAVVMTRRFNPSNRFEFRSTKGNHRLFAVAVDSAEGTILVKACDWPHTFFSPFILGDATWPEKFTSANCLWSKDGTVAVWEVQAVNDKTKRYESAYDFREHHSIDPQRHAWSEQFCNETIAELVTKRGGVESPAIDIPSLNSGLYQK